LEAEWNKNATDRQVSNNYLIILKYFLKHISSQTILRIENPSRYTPGVRTWTSAEE